MREIQYDVDIMKQNYNYKVCMQGDDLKVILNVYSNGLKCDLTGASAKLNFVKNDGTPVTKDAVINGNILICALDKSYTDLGGKANIEFEITKNGTITTYPLELVIIKKVFNSDKVNNKLVEVLDTIKMDEYVDIFMDSVKESVKELGSEINKINKQLNRKLKATLSIAEWWTYTASDSSEDAVKLVCASHERITQDLELFKKIGVDGLSLCVYGTYGADKLDTSITTNHWYMVQKIDDVLYICSECERLGLKVTHLKFMFYGLTNYGVSNTSFIKSHLDTFKPFWKEAINNYCKAIKEAGYNVDVVTILNEVPDIYNANSYKDLVLELLNIPKTYNYKASISCTNLGEIIIMNTDITSKLDVLCCNMYPKGSYNGAQATLEEQIQCWDRMIILSKALKEDYPEKQLFITETGCRDTWEALAQPGNYDIDDSKYTKSYGKSTVLFLKGLFESEMMNYASNITYWYFDSLYNTNTREVFPVIKEFLNEYLGVVYNE